MVSLSEGFQDLTMSLRILLNNGLCSRWEVGGGAGAQDAV